MHTFFQLLFTQNILFDPNKQRNMFVVPWNGGGKKAGNKYCIELRIATNGGHWLFSLEFFLKYALYARDFKIAQEMTQFQARQI